MYSKAASTQVGIQVIGDNNFWFGLPHWNFGDAGAPSLSGIWSTAEDGSNIQAHGSHALDLSVDSTATPFQLDAFDDHIAGATSGGDGDGSVPYPTAYTGSVSVVDHIDVLNIQVDDTSTVDWQQIQLASASSDASEGMFSAGGWFGVVDVANTPGPAFQAPDFPAEAMGQIAEPGVFAGFAADAKGAVQAANHRVAAVVEAAAAQACSPPTSAAIRTSQMPTSSISRSILAAAGRPSSRQS